MTDGAPEGPPDFLRRDAPEQHDDLVAKAELLLESHRVTGTLEQPGAPRRLVDILNNPDGPALVMRDATVESLASPGEAAHSHEVLHVRREAILLAVPVTAGAPSSGDPEVVDKRRTAATLMLPGLEITGHIYLPPEADPSLVRLVGRHDFLPVTDAEVTHVTFGPARWRRPLVVVSLERVTLYAPAPR